MTWNTQKSSSRIESRWQGHDVDINVTDLKKEMNLENVTLRDGRMVTGVHIYTTVGGTKSVADVSTSEAASSSAQTVALWRGEVSRIADALDIATIAFQGERVHMLSYRPIGDATDRAERAVLLAAAIEQMTRRAFNPLFSLNEKLSARSGLDVGETLATRGGTRGDSELLFLGPAANSAAKMIDERAVSLSKAVIDDLSPDFASAASIDVVGDCGSIVLSNDAFVSLMRDRSANWSVSDAAARLAEDLANWPLERFGVEGASSLIDVDGLSRSKSKNVLAAALFVDIDGFSDYVSAAQDENSRRDAILTLDAIRQEFRSVLKDDFDGVRIQYQGDNMVGLLHLPANEAGKLATLATELAAAIQSSMDETLPLHVPDAQGLHVTVGVALGDLLISKLGKHAKRDALMLGAAANAAEAIQTKLEAGEVGITPFTYENLDTALQPLFEERSEIGAWVATSATASNCELLMTADGGGEDIVVSQSNSGKPVITTGAAAVGEVNRVRRPIRAFAH